MREIAVFGGTAHPALAAEICADLGVPPRPVRFTRFANDCLEVQLQSNCRDRDVFLIQLLVPPVFLDLADGSGAPAAEPPRTGDTAVSARWKAEFRKPGAISRRGRGAARGARSEQPSIGALATKGNHH